MKNESCDEDIVVVTNNIREFEDFENQDVK